MNNSQQILGTESVGKLLLKYSVPAIIGMMVNALYNVVDRMFIGNIPDVGPMAITGLGVTMPISTIIRLIKFYSISPAFTLSAVSWPLSLARIARPNSTAQPGPRPVMILPSVTTPSFTYSAPLEVNASSNPS